jgi:sugar/nucleoside kinase (ribokinase family)
MEPLDVVGIGNAIVDVLTHADDAFLVRHGLAKGAMTLVNETEAERIYAAMGPGIEISGGSAANTIAGVASLGRRAAFIGKVRDDQLGAVFRHDIRAQGVVFDTPAAASGPATARSMIVVTPDAQRTMNTYLGACVGLTPEDVDPALIGAAEITYLEGYLWDAPAAKAAMRRAMELAHKAGRRVALTLSDSFCVERYRDEFLHLVEHDIDILFANEGEVRALYGTHDFDEALQVVRRRAPIAALTRSARGSVIVAGDEIHVIDAHPVGKVVDTTGAGDLYAAGFLGGLTRGHDLGRCGRMASLCAAEAIAHIGARPQVNLRQLELRTFG